MIRPTRRRPAPLHDTRAYWLIGVMQTFAIAVVSYVVAVFTFLVLTELAAAPNGGYWDEGGLRSVLFFVMMTVVVGILMVPYFQREWDGGLRTFSMFTATFLVAYAVFRANGFVDPNVPFDLMLRFVLDPLRARFGF